MIITYIKFDNIYSFKNSTLDLTFDRTLKDSPIDGEFIESRPNFKFKKVCIISGANACGKTSFGRALCSVQNFLQTRSLPDQLLESIKNKEKNASFIIEFATLDDLKLHRVYVSFNSKKLVSLTYVNTKIGKQASGYITRKKLINIFNNKEAPRLSMYLSFDRSKDKDIVIITVTHEFSKFDFTDSGWLYLVSENHFSSNPISFTTPELMSSVLRTFDPNIKDVEPIFSSSDEKEFQFDGYNIKFDNGDSVLVDKDGNVAKKRRLSRGTFEAISVTELIARVLNDDGENVYYLDEGMAHSHTEIEQSVLNLLIEKLNRYSQLFYTTHNYDILDLNLPVHNFVFFKKDKHTVIILPEHSFKKNDRTLLNFVKNDVFNTLPDVGGIDSLLMDSQL